MSSTEEPYHFLQKKIGSILEELGMELNDNVSEFKKMCKEVYAVEEVILKSRNTYIQASKEIEEEVKKQKELETVLDYFDSEIDKLGYILHTDPVESTATPNYSILGDIDSLIGEFNAVVRTMDVGVPQAVSILVSENINLVRYAEMLIKKMLGTQETEDKAETAAQTEERPVQTPKTNRPHSLSQLSLNLSPSQTHK
ncbi:hypothetical protein NECID01_1222 [Nematocida sp. AWRm77]|nr:hypothetical protein NECID01_1222 [Nematocida sp. AWRm77]